MPADPQWTQLIARKKTWRTTRSEVTPVWDKLPAFPAVLVFLTHTGFGAGGARPKHVIRDED
jgi:hypothetical protein